MQSNESTDNWFRFEFIESIYGCFHISHIRWNNFIENWKHFGCKHCGNFIRSLSSGRTISFNVHSRQNGTKNAHDHFIDWFGYWSIDFSNFLVSARSQLQSNNVSMGASDQFIVCCVHWIAWHCFDVTIMYARNTTAKGKLNGNTAKYISFNAFDFNFSRFVHSA